MVSPKQIAVEVGQHQIILKDIQIHEEEANMTTTCISMSVAIIYSPLRSNQTQQ